MAARLPGSSFLGIELSAEQTQEGKSRVAELGLNNCEIRQANLLDLQDEGLRFDYIITHGVYSWSPPEVRARIMELSAKLLSPHGVAYISFNSLPGWRKRGALRDMLLHRVREIRSPVARLEAAQDYLATLETGIEGLEAEHFDYLREEIERIRSEHPSYLYHEYLETYNEPMLLHDFIRTANEHRLDYICDIELAHQFPAHLEERVEQVLGRIEDPIEKLQQLDFLVNRVFHQSLLCHAEKQPSRSPDLEQLRNFAWIADLHPPKKLDLRRIKPAPFTHSQGEKYQISHPLTKAAIALLAERFPASVAFADLLRHAAQRVRGNGGGYFAEQEDDMLHEMFSLYATGVLHARPLDMLESGAELNPWQMEAVVRRGILRGDSHIPTIHHASIHLDQFAARVIRYLDGHTYREALLPKLVADFGPGGDLEGMVDAGMSPEMLASHLGHYLDQLLALLRKHGVLG